MAAEGVCSRGGEFVVEIGKYKVRGKRRGAENTVTLSYDTTSMKATLTWERRAPGKFGVSNMRYPAADAPLLYTNALLNFMQTSEFAQFWWRAMNTPC